ncbi:MAG TPA: RNB domain-containing ribonuclease [Desulfobacteraceae bacterium]|nr:RNB domain-containing ribonuclease [Desulfobacteraceae bacterium]HPJ66830.1 RNB domain-containing ribonuclease [Desulfobacteraceae bacterium]HPQ29532.1 RNB domain-containing ribonuclease [Desulfobacteraceae bacterium]
MNQGKIIEYIEHDKFHCTLCLQDKGNKLHLLTPSNKEVNLSAKRALLISQSAVDTQKPREELLEKLKQIEESRDDLKKGVDVKELSELVRDEEESFDNRYLAQLVFGEYVTDDHISALVRALFEDRLYFRMRDGRFIANTSEHIEKTIKNREEEALREEKLIQGSLWLKSLQQGTNTFAPSSKREIIDLLIQMALYGTDAPDFKYGKELLARAGIFDIRESRNLLISMGVWEEDENIDLIRLGIPIAFTREQLKESASLASEITKTLEGREDLRKLPSITIDGPFTRDYDDAISLEMVGDNLQLGIHISDVSSVIPVDSLTNREASERASSHYFPGREIPMIPPSLSENRLSLIKDHDRPALSLFIRFDKNIKLLDYRFTQSLIRVKRQLTYDEVNDSMPDEPMFQKMHEISSSLLRDRMNRGAISLSLPELNIRINAESSLSLKLIEQDTPSRKIVAELMILYNYLAAKFCYDNIIPILFRTQPEPNEILTVDESGYVYYVFRQRRKLRPLAIDTSPAPHSILGLEQYTHVTSPIRRYLDLVVQRQMCGFISGGGLVYDKKDLEEIRISVEPIIREMGNVKRKRLRYWVLKFLSQHPGEKYKAMILEEFKNKYRIVLCDFLILAEIKQKSGFILHLGEEIFIRVKKVSPWDDLLDLDYA